jgi:hypothetical protein
LVIDSVSIEGITLSEVASGLREESAKRDPEKKGVNFIISHQQDSKEGEDLGEATVRIDPPLRHINLVDLLEAICMTASQPLQYSVTDFGVVFSAKKTEPQTLITRVFRVEFGPLRQAVRNQLGEDLKPLPFADLNPDAAGLQEQQEQFKARQATLRRVFEKFGVNFTDTHGDFGSSGKALFYNDRTGDLFVRATEDQLSAVEGAIRVLTGAAPKNAASQTAETGSRTDGNFFHPVERAAPAAR